jgi:hypothetical protein
MSEFAVEGPELKKMVKLARKGPIPFAFNPGKNDSEHHLAMHRKRPAGVLAKSAKKEGAGMKVAFGTCEVKQKVMSLTCEKTVPAMAKKLKKFLKVNKVSLNVQILDANGNMLEEDIEDLPDDPDLYDDDDGQVADQAAQQEDLQQDTQPDLDPAAIVARIKAAQPRVAAAPAAVAGKLAPALKNVVAQVKAQDLEAAAQTMTQIETVLDKLPADMGQGAESEALADGPDAAAVAQEIRALAQDAQALPEVQQARIMKPIQQLGALLKAGEVARAAEGVPKVRQAIDAMSQQADAQSQEAPEDAEAAPDPRLDALRNRADALGTQASQLPEAQAAKIGQALAGAVARIDAGDADAAGAALDKIDAVMAKLGVQAEAAPSEPEAEPDQPNSEAAWLTAYQTLKPAADAAIKEHRFDSEGEEGTFRTRLQYAETCAADGDFDKALSVLPGLQKMLDAAAQNAPGTSGPDIGEDVRPFATSRVKWASTRSTMHNELKKLQDAIAAACQEHEDLADVAGEVTSLTDYLMNLDERLEDKLDEIVNAEDSAARDKHKDDARKLLKEYQAELQSDFFQDVDAKNGFVNVAVASTAAAALAEIHSVLS